MKKKKTKKKRKNTTKKIKIFILNQKKIKKIRKMFEERFVKLRIKCQWNSFSSTEKWKWKGKTNQVKWSFFQCIFVYPDQQFHDQYSSCKLSLICLITQLNNVKLILTNVW